MAEKEKSAPTLSLRWALPIIIVRHMTPEHRSHLLFFVSIVLFHGSLVHIRGYLRHEKRTPKRCPYSWRRKRDLLLSSLPQNSPLDYFLPNGNTQSKDCSLLIRIPLSFFCHEKRTPKGVLFVLLFILCSNYRQFGQPRKRLLTGTSLTASGGR